MLVLTACTTEPAVKRDRMALHSVLLLPVRSVHAELLAGSSLIDTQLFNRLKKSDFNVEELPPQVINDFEKTALELSGSVYDPKLKQFVTLDKSAYTYHLISLISKNYEFDAVLMPELLLRTTRINVDEAAWDGVEREIEFVNKPERLYKLPKSARGISLQLQAFSRRGAKISAGFGGISLPYKVDYVKGKAAFALKPIFYQSSEIKEGVSIALMSFHQVVKAE